MYTYSSGNLSTVKQTDSGNSDVVSFTYDKLGRSKTATYDDGRVLTYVCNGEGQLHSLTETNGSNTVTYLYTYDAIGNPTSYCNGTVFATYEYDPYGKVISATGTLANVNPLRYRGYVYDQETGFYYLQSRYYDPAGSSMPTPTHPPDRALFHGVFFRQMVALNHTVIFLSIRSDGGIRDADSYINPF